MTKALSPFCFVWTHCPSFIAEMAVWMVLFDCRKSCCHGSEAWIGFSCACIILSKLIIDKVQTSTRRCTQRSNQQACNFLWCGRDGHTCCTPPSAFCVKFLRSSPTARSTASRRASALHSTFTSALHQYKEGRHIRHKRTFLSKAADLLSGRGSLGKHV